MSDTWITPKYIINSLGTFDIDPCCPKNMPWKTAEVMYSLPDDGLKNKWQGRIWLNPPYSDTFNWMWKMSQHNNGIALVFVKTETNWFLKTVWEKASAIIFIKGRIKFCTIEGEKGKYAAPYPSALVAYNPDNAKILKESGIIGKFMDM